MTIYLYKKTHNKTGLQYLGKTSQDPFKYKGSGTRWIRHIKKHGNDVSTEILLEASTNDEIKKWGLYYSNKWNVVESDQWANIKPETGEGGGSKHTEERKKKHSEIMSGHPNWLESHTQEAKAKIGIGARKRWDAMTTEEKFNVIKNTISSPDSWTLERKQRISNAKIGVPLSEEHKKNVAIGHAEYISTLTEQERTDKYGSANKGKTWKLVDGKRVWFNKEN
jgi:hypothetical protein